LNRLDARLAYTRLAVFAAWALVAYAVVRGPVSAWWLLAPGVVFVALMKWHDTVIAARDQAAAAMTFYQHGLARIEDRWQGTGSQGQRFRDDAHPYATDLDLFGPASLFELLSRARTDGGEATLARWLLTPATPDAVRSRQQAVRELAPALDLREALSGAGSRVGARVRSDALIAWAESPRALSPAWLRWIAMALTAGSVATAVWWAWSGRSDAFVAMMVVQGLFALPQATRVTNALHAAEGPARDLDILSHLLGILEHNTVRTPRLEALRTQIQGHGVPASTAIRGLARLVEAHDWQHNPMFTPFSLALLWGTHVAWAIEGWRHAHGAHVRGWIEAVGEYEALSSLASYAYEHPADPFPQLDDQGGRDDAHLIGEAMGHPLLPAAKTVRNDIQLDPHCQMLLVSGSNMSGKSTYLRTVGVNVVLALAGAPVRAKALRLTPLALGATLRIQDSLQEGRSRFYAEITRVRELADLSAGSTPLLFLLDELFHGTNSHDRRVGAAGVLRSLLNRGAIGLVTTHDLALTAIGEGLPGAINVHFEDWFDGGEMRFDYTVKPGPVTRSNALALMKAVGLDVEE
jgi:hypothetical protein